MYGNHHASCGARVKTKPPLSGWARAPLTKRHDEVKAAVLQCCRAAMISAEWEKRDVLRGDGRPDVFCHASSRSGGNAYLEIAVIVSTNKTHHRDAASDVSGLDLEKKAREKAKHYGIGQGFKTQLAQRKDKFHALIFNSRGRWGRGAVEWLDCVAHLASERTSYSKAGFTSYWKKVITTACVTASVKTIGALAIASYCSTADSRNKNIKIDNGKKPSRRGQTTPCSSQ